MKNRICSGIMLFCLLLTMPACAAGADQPAAGSAEKMANQTAGFTDVPADAWYAGAVQYCRENSLTAGTSDTTFAPETTLTRAMLVTILWRQAEKPVVNYLMQFSDVPEGQWYSETVRWAASEKLVAGYGDGRFGTNDPITLEQLNLIFQRYTDQPVTDGIPGFDGSFRHATREAMEELGLKREDIFVTTKIYPGSEMANPEQAIQACLDRLNIDYVDLMLLHHPDRNDVIPYIQDLGIVVQGWYPLGGRGHTAELLGDEVIFDIAKAHGASSAQVILRWNLQKGVVVIPGSSNPDHIKENTELYGFALTEAEMAQINALDRNEKHDWY